MNIKNLSFFLICLLLALQSNAQVNLGFPGEKSAQVGIYIKNLQSGEVIAQNDTSKAMLPASVMKAITAATAFTTLDKDFRFKTEVYLTGDISDGVCNGNLKIVSSADPTIDSEMFTNAVPFSKEITNALLEKGIKRINGKIVVVEKLSGAGCIPEWEIDDVAWGYGAGLYGFNYRDNKFDLWPATGKSQPHVPDLDITVKSSTGENLVRGVFSNHIIAYGPNTSSSKWVVTTTMNSPADVFACELENTLRDNGIEVGNEKDLSNSGSTLVINHLSPSLYDILHQTLIHSHNMFAEAMLRTIAPGSTRSAAINKELNIWNNRGVSTSYMRICDGSGLSRADRIRPDFIAGVLEWMANSDYSKSYASLFPKVGVEGTVKNFLKGSKLQGKLALKTGSMNAVQCYAGYMLDDNGAPTHVVVVLVNAFYCERSTLRSKIESFLLKTL